MRSVADVVKKYFGYLFILLGLAWVGIILTGGAALLLWPALTSIFSGTLQVLRPERRFSSAMASASALYGLLLAGYQAYVATALLGSVFSTIATYSLVSFSVIAILYLVLLYASFSRKAKEAEGG